LAERIGIRQPAIAQIEAGQWQPLDVVVEALSLQLGFPPAFFRRDRRSGFPLGSLLYRAHACQSAKERSETHRYAELMFELGEQMAKRVRGLSVRGAPLNEDPVTAARLTRDKLGLSPEAPVPNVIRTLERAGVFVFALPLTVDGHDVNVEDTDAFSLWGGEKMDRPVIAFVAGRPGDRIRLSCAHELGHLVLHTRLRESQVEMEREAYEFGAEFLMPESAMREEVQPPVTLLSVAQLKQRWGVSIQALIKRAHSLEIITERQYRYFFEQLSHKGWRKEEPPNLAVAIEKPRALTKMAEVCYGDPVDLRRMAADMQLSPQMIRDLLDLEGEPTRRVVEWSQTRRPKDVDADAPVDSDTA
jgi:Zn-dependent peptidase ImmA (M78 family)